MKRRNKELDGFESWGGYMEAKKSKLIQQFKEDTVKCSSKENDLFKGVAIFVNGYTVPSAEELRSLMMKHGGSYHHYYKSGSTTHIIATNLPDSKLKLTKNHKIVKPSWIVDSIKAGKVLNYCDYLWQSSHAGNQPSVKNMLHSYNNNNKRATIKDATHEGFLTEFYNNSRLHHISTMGAIFKDYVNDIRNDKNHKLSGRNEILQNSYYRRNYNVSSSLRKETSFIMHIDMDCFFVSVGLRNKSELRGHPVAVTHSNGNQARVRDGVNAQQEIMAYRNKLENSIKNQKRDEGKPEEHWSFNINEFDSMAEIASCSYEARKAGVKNGMFVGQALKLCPDLKFIHYDFDSYKEVSSTLYNTVARYTVDIEAVSCDEMYANCTDLLKSISMEPMEFADILRGEIKQKTGCPCSIGFGGNRLQARLATKKAKPDGQFHLKEEDVISFMYTLPVSDLPGVGGSTNFKLKSMGIKTCGDLQNISLSRLQEELGKKLGETLHNNSFGKDEKPLVYIHVRKSISADINYGIRFQNDNERDIFLKQLSEEVSNRLVSAKMKGRSITLKLMVRSKDAPKETAKYLGHGLCDQISKGTTLSSAISAPSIIFKEVLNIMKNANINCKELRGVGIQLSRLEPDVPSENKIMQFFTHSKKQGNGEKAKIDTCGAKTSLEKEMAAYEKLSLSQIDHSFLDALPDDIKKELLSNFKSNRTTAELKEREKKLSVTEENCRNELIDEQIYAGKSSSIVQRNEETASNSDEVKTYISPSELRLLIKQWVEMEEDPHSRDIGMITQYFKHLIAADHLEDLLIIIKSFFRYISRNKKPLKWKQAYIKIVDDTQSCISEKYQSKLIMEDTFSII